MKAVTALTPGGLKLPLNQRVGGKWCPGKRNSQKLTYYLCSYPYLDAVFLQKRHEKYDDTGGRFSKNNDVVIQSTSPEHAWLGVPTDQLERH
jgi:hypothetical protein